MAARTFKVESKRSDKSFPMTSIQLSQFVGGELNEAFPHIQADMHTPEVVVHVEVRDFAAYVHANPTPGAGGLPVGVGGPPFLCSPGDRQPRGLLDDGQTGAGSGDGPLFQLPLHLPEAKEKVLELARLLTPGAAASPSTWSPLQRFRRNSAAAALSPSSPCSCAGS